MEHNYVPDVDEASEVTITSESYFLRSETYMVDDINIYWQGYQTDL